MPRHITKNNTCKIRKRVISSSSSSSSLVKSYRFNKRAIIAKNRTNFIINTQQVVPTWKLIMAGSKSPIQKLVNFGENGVKYGKNSNGGNYKGKDGFTARKLAASLWEINELHSPNKKSYEKYEKVSDHGQVNYFPRSPFSEKSDGSKVRSHRRSLASSSQKNHITEHIADGVDSVGKASSFEVESDNTTGDINNSSMKTHLKDINSSLTASKELVKVLFRILSNEEQQSSKLTLVSALRVELERAKFNISQLAQEQRFNSTQIDALLKKFGEEKASWKSKEKARIREAVSSVSKELEMERKLRRQAERLNKKLGTELAETRAYFSRAVKEIDDERQAREMLEKTCDELAKGIGQERAEVEKLKQEAEKERQMLQLADILREERVQMKLAEARYEFEEKNAALERLKTELQTCMKDEGNEDDNKGDGLLSHFDGTKELNDFVKTRLGSVQIDEKEASEGEVDDEEEDSCDSELHSIELNMDNKNKSYKWSFTRDGTNQGEVFKGRRSLSENIQWENICLQKRTCDSIELDFCTNTNQPNADDFDKEISTQPNNINNNGGKNINDDYEDDITRFQMIKPDRLSESSRLREACSAILQDLALKRDKIQGQCSVNKR